MGDKKEKEKRFQNDSGFFARGVLRSALFVIYMLRGSLINSNTLAACRSLDITVSQQILHKTQ
jgi:hypothetical protein